MRLDKCEWFVPEIEYLGFVISSRGRQPNPSLVSALLNFAPPVNCTQVGTFLGMLGFYAEFLPNLSTVAKPLRQLSDSKFVWTPECQAAFDWLSDSEAPYSSDPRKLWMSVCLFVCPRFSS